MEHLFLFDESELESVEYPGCLDYIGIPFLEYPQLRGREFYVRRDKAFNWHPHRRDGFEDFLLDETSFLSTWLFAGLLQEFFGDFPERLGQTSMYRHVDFFRTIWSDSGDRQIMLFCTKKLNLLLNKWKATVTPNIEGSREHYKHLRICLEITQYHAHCASSQFVGWIPIIIAVTAEFLSLSLDLTFKSASYYNDERNGLLGFMVPPIPTSLRLDAVSKGWCPSEIHKLWVEGVLPASLKLSRLNVTRNLPYGMYTSCPDFQLSNLHTNNRWHESCTVSECVSTQTSFTKCSCSTFRFAASVWHIVLRIIETGIPLLQCRANTSNSFDVDVVSYQSGLNYVAISHVASEGLGNAYANEIPTCRLHHVIEATFACWTVKLGHRPDEVYLWLDTLLCPVSPVTATNRVLESMRDIYSFAEYVLVLEGELQTFEVAASSELEIGLRVVTSRWTTRLWTLQESVLAKEVWIKFRDTSFLLDSLRTIFPDHEEVGKIHLVHLFKLNFWTLRPSLAKESEMASFMWNSARTALRSRSVTVTTDEPLCLATYIGLDASQVASTAPAERMRVFWQIVGTTDLGIPRGLLFDERPKLTAKGFGWAPATLLGGVQLELTIDDEAQTTLTEHGLLVRSKGLLLQHNPMSARFRSQGEQIFSQLWKLFRSIGTYQVRDQDGTWYEMGSAERLSTLAPASSKWAKAGMNPHDTIDLQVEGVAKTVVIESEQQYDFAILLPTDHNYGHLVRIERYQQEKPQVSIVEAIFCRRLNFPLIRLAYDIAQRTAALMEGKDLTFNEVLDITFNDIVETTSSEAIHNMCYEEGLSEERAKGLIFNNMVQILAGVNFVHGKTVPETQQWFYE